MAEQCSWCRTRLADNEIITIYADDEAAAEQKILELAKKLRRLLKDKP